MSVSGLGKKIGVWQGIALAFSIVVGSGVFGLIGIAIEENGAPASAYAWITITFVVAPLVYLFSKLGRKFPSAAGVAKYASYGCGSWAGVAVTFVIFGTAIFAVPATALVAAEYICEFFQISSQSHATVAVFLLTALSALNIAGVKFSARLNITAMLLMLFFSVIVIAWNVDFLPEGLSVLKQTEKVEFKNVWGASALLFWAFVGWEELSFGLEEFKDPDRTIPIVFWVTFVGVSLLYLLLAFVAIGLNTKTQTVLGTTGLMPLLKQTPYPKVMLAIMVFVLIANTNASVFVYSRMVFSAAREDLLPKRFAKLSKAGTPIASVIVSFFIYVLVLSVDAMTDFNIDDMILLTDQNFIFLYIFSIIAFWKAERGTSRILGTLAALISCFFLLSGFRLSATYPIALLGVGYLIYLKRRKVVKLIS